jgi:hypothetical protein
MGKRLGRWNFRQITRALRNRRKANMEGATAMMLL